MWIRTSMSLLLVMAVSAVAWAQQGNEPEDDAQKLATAIDSGSIAAVRRLLDAGVSPDTMVYGSPAIQWAIWDEKYYVVKLLLDRGADVNLSREDGYTPLICASAAGNAKVVKLLLDKGADVNAVEKENGLSALQNACAAADEKVFDMLVERGADVQHVDKHGGNCLEEAAFNGAKGIVEKLRAKGLETKWPLHVACGIGDVQQVEKLLAEGADATKANDGWQNTPLHFAAGGGQLEAAKLLAEKDADVNVKNVFGATPLHYVASVKNVEFAKWLVAQGADINAVDEDGATPLDWAGGGVGGFLRAQGAKQGESTVELDDEFEE